MPCRYVVNEQYGLIISTAWDRVSFADVAAHQQRLLRDPDYDPEFKQLIDATAVTSLDLSTNQIADILARRKSTARWAFVAKDLMILSVGRLLEARAARIAPANFIQVFSNRDQALRWLGMEHVPAQLL